MQGLQTPEMQTSDQVPAARGPWRHLSDPAARPQLLVSVRSAEEAVWAIEGGADIVDIKEPARGPLGAADGSVWGAVAQVAHSQRFAGWITGALGELLNPDASIAPEVSVLSAVKVGLAGCQPTGHSPPIDWRLKWDHKAVQTEQAGFRGVWVAVGYLDDERAAAPPIDDVLTEAIRRGCAGLLLDTWDKSHGSWQTHTTTAELTNWADRLHRAGLFLALGGRVSLADVPSLLPLPMDVIAVRGAACVGADRTGQVCVTAVRQLADAMGTRSTR